MTKEAYRFSLGHSHIDVSFEQLEYVLRLARIFHHKQEAKNGVGVQTNPLVEPPSSGLCASHSDHFWLLVAMILGWLGIGGAVAFIIEGGFD